MAGKLDQESRMAIKVLKERGSSANSIARTVGVTEGAVRYHPAGGGRIGRWMGLEMRWDEPGKSQVVQPGWSPP